MESVTMVVINDGSDNERRKQQPWFYHDWLK